MMRLMTHGFAFIALTVSAWCNASTLDIAKLCGDFELLKHSENRVYRGQFEDGGTVLDHALVVTPVTREGETVVFYVWGEQPSWNVSKAGCRPGTGAKKGDTLAIYWEDTLVAYKFSGNGASVKYTWRGFTRNGQLTRSTTPISVSQSAKAEKAPEKRGLSPGQVPTYAVGDKLVWREKDGKNVTFEVSQVDGNMVAFRMKNGCSWTVRVDGFPPTRSWKNCKVGSGSQAYTRRGNVFPLKVGNVESWTYKGKTTKGDTWSGFRKCEVKGTAQVSVPAGKFETYNIVCTEKSRRHQWQFSPELGVAVTYYRKPLKGSSGGSVYRKLVRFVPAN